MSPTDPEDAQPRAAIMHVGCGLLGLGAVIPLLEMQFADCDIFLVQRSSALWRELVPDTYCSLTNTGGFFQSYLVAKVGTPHEIEAAILGREGNHPARVLIVVPDLGYATSLVRALTRNGRHLTLACSLGGAQRELAIALRGCVSTEWQVLLFENTPAREWESVDLRSRRWHVVTDRICWDIKPSGGAFGEDATPVREGICESTFASFKWKVGTPGLSSAVVPEIALRFGFNPAPTLKMLPDAEFAAAVRAKRALINATHVVLSILCCRLLAERRLGLSGQYLTTIAALLDRAHPEWNEALETYMRIRCLEVAADGRPASDEAAIAAFEGFLVEARNARKRFLETADELERVMGSERLANGVKQYREHVVAPFERYHAMDDTRSKRFAYVRPDPVEVEAVKEFLSESFLQVMEWLPGQQGKKMGPPSEVTRRAL